MGQIKLVLVNLIVNPASRKIVHDSCELNCGIFKMKKLTQALLLFAATVASNSYANSEWRHISQSVTTQMSQNGSIDRNRFIIFDFSYSNGKRDKAAPGYCWVSTIIINNANCASEEMIGSGKSFWLKSEFSSRETHGDDFICKYTDINESTGVLTVEEPKDFGEKIIHKLAVTQRKYGNVSSRAVVDYSGALNKFSTATGKLESINYIAVKGKNSRGWTGENLGCKRIALPTVGN